MRVLLGNCVFLSLLQSAAAAVWTGTAAAARANRVATRSDWILLRVIIAPFCCQVAAFAVSGATSVPSGDCGRFAHGRDRIDSFSFDPQVGALAASSALTASGESSRVAPLVSSVSCSTLVALAIGAVTPCASNHASETCAGVEWVSPATLSSAARMRKPRGFNLSFMRPPRGLLPKSVSERYLPVRNPLARL